MSSTRHSLQGISEDAPLLRSSNQHSPRSPQSEPWDIKQVAFVFVGVITLFYVIGELGVAITKDSLVLLSDGFHNLSDVFALYIAYWARKASKWNMSQKMSYGWARSETLGALTNGIFLLSLCLYVMLQTIPRFISPEPVEGSLSFIIVAAAGLAINTLGTIIFALTGQGHSHSHGGGGGHGHDHGHSHSSAKEDHSHSHSEKKEKKEKKEKHGHEHSHEHEHGHTHSEKKNKKKEKHSHSHDEKPKKEKMDANTHAVFLHYLGDAISSLMVLAAGLLMHFFSEASWVQYIDPITSLLVVALILWTTIPLVKGCSLILLQSTPTHVDPSEVRGQILNVPGIIGLHDFHVWQLVDGLVICSVHVSVEQGAEFINVVDGVKSIFHRYGIHSSAIQPEFIIRDAQGRYSEFCVQNCVEDCKEDWCCKNAEQAEREAMVVV